MNKNTRKVLALSVMSMFVFMLLLNVVSADAASDAAAQAAADAGINSAITRPAWLVSTIKFMGFGSTWADFIVSVAVLIMIFAAAYDILAFTAFESPWVKFVIAFAIAAITGAARGVVLISKTLMAIAGGSVAFATAIAIIAAAFLFFLTGIAKGQAKKFKFKGEAAEAETAFRKSAITAKEESKKFDAMVEK